jgi:OmpA-OmpF porin, OOP family
MKKTRLTQTVAAVLIAGGAMASHAEGFYAGGAIGAPRYSGDAINGVDGSGSGVGGKVFGGYEFNKNFSLEGGVFDLGHIDAANGKVNLRGAYVDAVGKYELAPQWLLTGSAGVAEGRFKTSNGDDSSPALKLGVGVEYAMTHNTSLSLGYDRYHFTDAFDGKPNVGSPYLGVKVGF